MTDPAHAEKLLLDRYLPHFDTTIAEHVIVPADQQTTWEALSQLDLMRVHTPLMDAAMRVRGLPSAIAGALGRDQPAPPDPGSARSFRRYWVVVRPFVAHIMRASLETLRDDARQLHEPTDEAASERDRA